MARELSDVAALCTTALASVDTDRSVQSASSTVSRTVSTLSFRNADTRAAARADVGAPLASA
jgi:hypothetical protein